MNIRFTLSLVPLLISILSVQAQVTGTILDERQQPLPGAVVRAFTQNRPVKATITDAAGQFRFERSAAYYVVSYTGYLTDTLKTAGVIRLSVDTRVLKEITVKGRQPVLRQETDRTVITVNEQVKKLANNALELLNLAPGVTISDDENAILMSGRSSVQVMLNDKVVRLTPRDLAKLLKALPSGAVASIEVMTNPPATYETDGRTGLINIRTRTGIKGFNGNLDYSASQSTYNWSDLSGMLNYGSGKLAISSYGGWHKGGYLTNHRINRQLGTGNLYQQTSHLDQWNDPIFRINADMQLSPHSVIGGLIEREASNNTATYTTASSISTPDSNYQTNGRSPYVQHWHTYNLNYRYRDTTGNTLTADMDRADQSRDNQTDVSTTGQTPLIYHTLTNSSINTLKTDYTHHWKDQTKLEAGFKLAAVSTYNNQDGNLFDYRERIVAAYTSWSKTYKHWGLQAGLRAEHTSAKGIAATLVKPDTAYLNILPSFYLTYGVDKHAFRLSFSRRVRRPDYADLQPITYQLDPLNYTTGNPGLRVQRNDLLELAYTFNDRISLVGLYWHAADYFNQVMRQAGNVLYQTPGNTGTMNTFNFDLNYPVKAAKWWNMLYKLNVAEDHFRGQQFQGFLDERQWHYQLSATQRINLPGGYLLQLGARYTSASLNLLYRKQSDANTTASISKQFLKDQATIKLGISDLFKTQRNYTSVDFGSLRYTDLGNYESRRVSFSLTWRFGNRKVRQTADRERGDADEKNRSGS